MRILVTGPHGQLGQLLSRALAPLGDVVAADRSMLDLTSEQSIRETLALVRPDLVVNAAAYTNVDRAEEDLDTCRAVNELGPAVLAAECRNQRAALIHYSTDYVFDGGSVTPYTESDPPRPLNTYGRTKLAGEQAIEASGAAFLIFRCSWLYSDHGKNFVTTILRLAREREELTIVDDQTGSPTWAAFVARATARILNRIVSTSQSLEDVVREYCGVYHLCARGAVTWYEFATAILGQDPNRREQVCRSVRPISSEAYGARAKRPAFSALCTAKVESAFGIDTTTWMEQLTTMLNACGQPTA